MEQYNKPSPIQLEQNWLTFQFTSLFLPRLIACLLEVVPTFSRNNSSAIQERQT